MIEIAEKKLDARGVKLYHGDILKTAPFLDKSFDVAISSYTVHGFSAQDREKMYREMSRLAKYRVIFHDYNQRRAPHITFIERLEGGDYFDFIKNPEAELSRSFKRVRVLDVGLWAAWYICMPRD